MPVGFAVGGVPFFCGLPGLLEDEVVVDGGAGGQPGGRKPTLELLLALARAYQVPLDELVGAPSPGATR